MVTLRADCDLEVEVVVGAVGHRLAQVPRNASAAQQRPGHTEPEQLLPRHDPDVARAREPDLVLVEERLVLLEALREDADELAALLLPARRDVLGDAADLEVARVHALAARHLEQVEHQVALADAPPEEGHGADVERGSGKPEQM